MRILLVEDERKIAQPLKKGLEQQGYAVDVAYDGEAGFDLASTENYALMILDLMLPKMDGITVCQNLRKNKFQLPILMLTAKEEITDKVNGLNCGADDYMTKPFSFDELLARIKALMRRPQSSIDTVLACGSLTLNTVTYEVTKQSKSIQLTRKEFALLELLIRNKNKILSKEHIIEHVWNFDADVLPNTVEVYIGYLRNKIDKPFKTITIQTVRGFGYMIKDTNV